MPATPYTYSIANDFPGGAVNGGRLSDEIKASAITIALDGVGGEGDVLTITFKAALSAGDKTILDGDAVGPAGGLISAHNNAPSALEVQVVKLDPTAAPPKIHPSPRPTGMSTYFSSAGDTGGLSLGPKLIFNMTDTDTEKSVDVSYNETVLVKDGLCSYVNAPLGSTISAEMYAPDGTTKVGGFVKNACMLGTHWMPFDTEDYGTLPATYKLRLTVKNSSGTNGEDAPANFKVIARVEMYRTTTV